MTEFVGAPPTQGWITSLPTFWVRDPRMSSRTRGLLSYLASHERGYRCTVQQMIAEVRDGKDAVYAMLKEAIELGYLKRVRQLDERGRVVKVVYAWGPAAMTQTYVRAWGDNPGSPAAEDEVFPQVATTSGIRGSGQPAHSDDDEYPQVESTSGLAGSGAAGSGPAGSGQADTKYLQDLEKPPTPIASDGDPPPMAAPPQRQGSMRRPSPRPRCDHGLTSCRRCGTNPRGRAQADAEAAAAPPPWCGECDRQTRLLSLDGGDRAARCPRCNPRCTSVPA